MKNILATILFVDVAGYTRLTQLDEEKSGVEINNLFFEIVEPILAVYDGTKVHRQGDGMLAWFRKPEQAVSYAIELQDTIADFNKHRGKYEKIQVRIGINHGHAWYDAPNKFLHGHAVNIASRLEESADVGGIWVSESVVKNTNDKEDFDFISLGSRRLQAVVGRVSIFGVQWTNNKIDFHEAYNHKKFAALNSSVAVLPFKILSKSNDSGAKILQQSIAEDVMTELGRFTEVTVINTDITSDDETTPLDIKQAGRTYAIDYVIAGSIVQYSSKIRIHARLLETTNGKQIWANRYDSDLNDIFDLQDTIARDLSSKLPVHIENRELNVSQRKSFISLDAYDCYIQGRSLYRQKTEETDQKAIELLERAIELDPEFADPYSILGAIHGINWAYSSWGIDPLERILYGRKLIKKALLLNNNLPRAHAHLAWTYLSTHDFNLVNEHFEKALLQNGNDPDILLLRAYAIMYMGESSESIRICKHLMELNPKHPDWYMDVLGGAHFIMRNYEKALELLLKVEDLFPECDGWIAACYGHIGDQDNAKNHAEKFLEKISRIWKGIENSDQSDYVFWFLNYACPFMLEADRTHMAEGLKKSGLAIPNHQEELIYQNNLKQNNRITNDKIIVH